MSASYPSAVKSFTTRVAGDTIQPAHVNDLQDEVAAIESDLRTNGGAPTGQIKFPSTQNASSDVNTLDDYEEGSWTPVLGGASGTSGQTYSIQNGHYVKIGQMVIATFQTTLTAKGTITGDVVVSGLPFTAQNVSSIFWVAPVQWFGLATNWVNVIGLLQPNTTIMLIRGATAAGTANSTSLAASDIGNSTSVIGTIVYRASS
jgi:hypothetical protein